MTLVVQPELYKLHLSIPLHPRPGYCFHGRASLHSPGGPRGWSLRAKAFGLGPHRDSSFLMLSQDSFDPSIPVAQVCSPSPPGHGALTLCAFHAGSLSPDLPVTSLSAPLGERGGQNSAKAWPSWQGGGGCKCFFQDPCVRVCPP